MPFGMVLQETLEEGKDGKEAKKKIKKIKTREGKSVKLIELLDEARDRAIKMFKERLESEDADTKVKVDVTKIEETAEKMGISAIKYYDLKQNRIQNYVFSFDKMLDPKGNTGVYLLYMYVRILSIIAKSKHGKDAGSLQSLKEKSQFEIMNPSEKELALSVLRLPEQLELAINDLQLNRLCDLLYEISTKIAEFYQQSKVIDSEQEESRVLLLEAVKKVMEVCFDLLGMKTIERL